MKLADKLRELRQAKGLTQEHMARILAITRRQYVKYELGELIPPHPKIKQLNKVLEDDLYQYL